MFHHFALNIFSQKNTLTCALINFPKPSDNEANETGKTALPLERLKNSTEFDFMQSLTKNDGWWMVFKQSCIKMKLR